MMDIYEKMMIIGFAPVLTYAACEWFLIFLMFIDALLSYLLVWFARYCRLQMPCFLCSKLLHPLHWRFLLCSNHRSEVSSLMSCHNHGNNLADGRSMCDDCLLSFTKMTAPNPDMNRVLLGKLGYDLLSRTHFAHPRSCSCCHKPWRTRHHTQILVRLGRNLAGKPNIPAPRQQLTRRGSAGSLKKMRAHKATSGTEYADIGSRSDGMAHVGYTELKIHSESESEFLFSDDDAFLRLKDFNFVASRKRVHKSRNQKSFQDKKKLPNHKRPNLQETKDKKIHVDDTQSDESSMPDRNVVDENKRQQLVSEPEEHEAVLSELVTMSEARPLSMSLPRADDAAQNESQADASGTSSPSCGEFLSPSGEIPASREIQFQAHNDSADSAGNISGSSEAAMEQKGSAVPGSVADESSSDEENGVEADFKPLTSSDRALSAVREQPSEEENEVKENNVAEEYFSNEGEEDEVDGHSMRFTPKDLSDSLAEEKSSGEEDAYSVAKSHSSNEEDNGDSQPLISSNVTGSATEEHSSKEDPGDHQETESLTSPKISNKESPLEHSDKDSSKATEAHNTSNPSPELKHSASVESFVSITSDMEGEGLVEVLKQQLEHDRKSLRDLSKELEEERSASAIATNQAMAMITRLQEEKAALHMEALQYLRMMDEQAEHDVDALEKANDVLADREKEIQDLEMELEYYRVKFPDEPREEILASMGILGDVEPTDIPTTDDTSDKAPTDIKPADSPSEGN